MDYTIKVEFCFNLYDSIYEVHPAGANRQVIVRLNKEHPYVHNARREGKLTELVLNLAACGLPANWGVTADDLDPWLEDPDVDPEFSHLSLNRKESKDEPKEEKPCFLPLP